MTLSSSRNAESICFITFEKYKNDNFKTIFEKMVIFHHFRTNYMFLATFGKKLRRVAFSLSSVKRNMYAIIGEIF